MVSLGLDGVGAGGICSSVVERLPSIGEAQSPTPQKKKSKGLKLAILLLLKDRTEITLL
jgi:hypothetical protein